MECTVDGCNRKQSAKKLCSGHYAQQRRGEEIRPIRGSNHYYQSRLNEKGEKLCTKCGFWQSLDQFYARNEGDGSRKEFTGKGLGRSHCNRCNILRRMGITFADYAVMLEQQGHACKICRRATNGSAGKLWLAVDHDHKASCGCGSRKACKSCIRGLICDSCNVMLGRAGDDKEVLRCAIEYLEGKTPVYKNAKGRNVYIRS